MENNLSIIKENFKELPNNIEAEQSVIGSILVSNEIFETNSDVDDLVLNLKNSISFQNYQVFMILTILKSKK